MPAAVSSSLANPTSTATSIVGNPTISVEQGSSGSGSKTAPVVFGLIFGILAALVLSFFVRRWYMARSRTHRVLY